MKSQSLFSLNRFHILRLHPTDIVHRTESLKMKQRCRPISRSSSSFVKALWVILPGIYSGLLNSPTFLPHHHNMRLHFTPASQYNEPRLFRGTSLIKSSQRKQSDSCIFRTSWNELYYHSSVTEDFLGLRTRSLTEPASSCSSFRIPSVISSAPRLLSTESSSPCPIFLFWLINCFTTNPWYLTRSECWSWKYKIQKDLLRRSCD